MSDTSREKKTVHFIDQLSRFVLIEYNFGQWGTSDFFFSSKKTGALSIQHWLIWDTNRIELTSLKTVPAHLTDLCVQAILCFFIQHQLAY